MNHAAFALFERYAQALRGEFRTEESLSDARDACIKIVQELEKIGFMILVAPREPRIINGRNEANEKISIIEITHLLYLLPINSGNPTPIATAEVSSRIYGAPTIEEESGEKLPGENNDDVSFLQITGIAPSSVRAPADTLWQKDWTFLPEDRCAFLASLERHWNEWEETAHKNEVPSDSQESIRRILETCRMLAPAGEHDVTLFTFFAETELRWLRRWPEEELSCGCSAKEHTRALNEWIRRNLLS